jgi:hypothetical protein
VVRVGGICQREGKAVTLVVFSQLPKRRVWRCWRDWRCEAWAPKLGLRRHDRHDRTAGTDGREHVIAKSICPDTPSSHIISHKKIAGYALVVSRANRVFRAPSRTRDPDRNLGSRRFQLREYA